MLLPLAFGGRSCSHKHTLTTTSVVSELALSLLLCFDDHISDVLMRDLHNIRMEQRSSSFIVFLGGGGEFFHHLKF